MEEDVLSFTDDEVQEEVPIVYVGFNEAFPHMLQGGKASVESFGLQSYLFFKDKDLYLEMEGTAFPMSVALEGEVLLSDKWVIR